MPDSTHNSTCPETDISIELGGGAPQNQSQTLATPRKRSEECLQSSAAAPLTNVNDERDKVEAGEGLKEAKDESKYPGPAAMGVVMVAVSFAMFLVSLDRTIISTAVPAITDQFRSSDDIGWYASAYQLTGCAMQLPLGRFYRFYPPRWVYMTLVLIFMIGSAIGAGAMSSTTIIVGRAVQGLGLGGVLSGSIILVTENAPLRKRPIFFGVLMACMNIGAIIGPLIGGALTSNASWRWCFLINIPIGLAVVSILFFFVKSARSKDHDMAWADKLRHLDPLGAALLLPCVVSLVLALQWAGSTYSWSNWRIILLWIVGGLLAIAFAISQKTRPEVATIPSRVAAQRTVVASLWYQTLTGGVMMVVTYWLPVWFQAIQGASPVESGTRTIALVLSQALGSIMGGGFAQFIGFPSPVMMIGSGFAAVGSGMLSTLSVGEASSHWIGYQILVGLGLGFGTQQASLAVQTVLADEDIPSGISLIFFGMQLGGSVFVCMAQNLFNQRFIDFVRRAAIPGVDPSTLLLDSGATRITDTVRNEADRVRLLDVYNAALTSTFYVSVAAAGAAFAGASLVQWKSVKGYKPRMH
ncbi:major facilitator superfamily domain-containing protein [Corynascus novoguineensis]|uniref:Major facilitator superfamily domain-containing protein n=1 Tax=Corynascus novoguineensis TaxID=1126955 RepID=A0AAN7CT75_9PEZI|nr:major facilitator superfamily domain-containing protein [Corynascus novoguineensis]